MKAPVRLSLRPARLRVHGTSSRTRSYARPRDPAMESKRGASDPSSRRGVVGVFSGDAEARLLESRFRPCQEEGLAQPFTYPRARALASRCLASLTFGCNSGRSEERR